MNLWLDLKASNDENMKEMCDAIGNMNQKKFCGNDKRLLFSSLPRKESYNDGLQIYSVKEKDRKIDKRWLDFIRLHRRCVHGKKQRLEYNKKKNSC